MGPFLSIGVFDVAVDLCVEFLYMWVREGRGAEGVSFNNDSFGDFSEVRFHVRNVTLGNVVLCGTGAHPRSRRKVTLIERQFPYFHECTNPRPFFKG